LIATGGVILLLAIAIETEAEARTIAIVPRTALRTRPQSKLVPGSVGTLEHAIVAQDKRRGRYRRPQTEGVIPDRDPDGVCPKEMSNVDGRFCTDKWEAMITELTDDGKELAWPATSALDKTKRYRAISMPGVIPQAYISGDQAAAACKESGKRLCEASEWRLACAGTQGSVYPYGTKHIENRCNDYGRAPMYVFYPQVERSWSLITNTDMNDPRLNELEGTIAKTGAHAGCVNDWGVYDMVGNVHEWTADPHGTFQGGYYLDTKENGEGCAYRTTAHPFDYHDYSTGFRCCADLKRSSSSSSSPFDFDDDE
jgi:formylglycine-generating enzyme